MAPRNVRGDVVVQVSGTKERQESLVQSRIDSTRVGTEEAWAPAPDVDPMRCLSRSAVGVPGVFAVTVETAS
jgi:NAD dependent epimerase/dehydratase family enzyme